MAGLGRAQRRSGGMEDSFRDTVPDGGFDILRDRVPNDRVPNDRRDTARPRIGSSARGRPTRRKADGLLLWRALALSASVLILGMGGLVAYHSMGPDARTADGSATKTAASATASPLNALATNTSMANTASANGLKGASETRPAKPTLKTVAGGQDGRQDGGHAQIATKVASILGAPAPAQAERANALQVASARPGGAEPAPTAADFARPAFLEPVSGDEAGDEASLPEGARQTVSDSAPATGVAKSKTTQAKPRTVAVASAEAGKDDDGRSARIRSAVTLRSGPKRSASAITTLDEGTKVTLYSCKSWCEVSAGDKRGFVYKSAVAQ